MLQAVLRLSEVQQRALKHVANPQIISDVEIFTIVNVSTKDVKNVMNKTIEETGSGTSTVVCN
jgi:hypothetical protein